MLQSYQINWLLRLDYTNDDEKKERVENYKVQPATTIAIIPTEVNNEFIMVT